MKKPTRRDMQRFADLHNANYKAAIESETDFHKWQLNMINGGYGEARQTGFGDECEIEIPSHHSATGNPVLFNW